VSCFAVSPYDGTGDSESVGAQQKWTKWVTDATSSGGWTSGSWLRVRYLPKALKGTRGSRLLGTRVGRQLLQLADVSGEPGA
jgi:hypothetical protein